MRSGAGARVASARWVADDAPRRSGPGRRYALMTSDFLAADAVGSPPARLSVADVMLCPALSRAAGAHRAALRAVLGRNPGCLLAITYASAAEVFAGTRHESVALAAVGSHGRDSLLAAAALAYGWLVAARLPLAALGAGRLAVRADADWPARLDDVLSVWLGVG